MTHRSGGHVPAPSRQMILMRMSRRDRLALFMSLALDAGDGTRQWQVSTLAPAAFDGWTNEQQVAAIMSLEGTTAH